MKPITLKQLAVLAMIKSFIEANNFSPTVRELSVLVGISPSVIHGYLHRLKERGMVEWESDCPRTLRILPQEVRTNAN
jgi:SOS-response transcriptional repressor LexA